MKLAVLAVIVSVFLLQYVADAADGKVGNCVCCDDAIKSVLGIVTTVIKKREPLVVENQAICKKVIITNVYTLTLVNQSSCLTKTKTTNVFNQVMKFHMKKISIICEVEDAQKLIDAECKKQGMVSPFANNPLMAPLNNVRIKGEWNNLTMTFKMKLDLREDGKHEMLEAECEDKLFRGLKLSCDGQSMTGQMCDLLTKPDAVKSAYGASVGIVAKDQIGKACYDPQVAGLLGSLTCAEPDYSGEE